MMTDIEENQIAPQETLLDRFIPYTVVTRCCLLLLIGTLVTLITIAIVYSIKGGNHPEATIVMIILGILFFCFLFCLQTSFTRF